MIGLAYQFWTFFWLIAPGGFVILRKLGVFDYENDWGIFIVLGVISYLVVHRITNIRK